MFLYQLPKIMAICLALTVTTEVFVSLILGVKGVSNLLIVALASVMTNPIVVCISKLINYYYGPYAHIAALVILEVFALITEGFVYRYALDYKKINPFLLSLILNAASYTIGVIIF